LPEITPSWVAADADQACLCLERRLLGAQLGENTDGEGRAYILKPGADTPCGLITYENRKFKKLWLDL